MTKRPLTWIALACAGACAIPLALPLFAGAGLITIGALAKPSLEALACGGLALVATAMLVLPRVLKAKPRDFGHEGASCSVDGRCGCRQVPKAGV